MTVSFSGKWQPCTAVQDAYVAIIMTGTLGVAFKAAPVVRAARGHFVTASLVFYVLSIGAVFKLRRRPD